VTCGGSSEEFSSQEFSNLVRRLPGLRVVLEHLGGGSEHEPTPDALEQRRRVLELARFPNVFIKIHGLGEFCRRRLPVAGSFPFERPIPPLLSMAYQAFGASRMMWGSDYPPVSAREGYHNSLQLTLDEFAFAGANDRALIFGQVALNLFPRRQ
jgi:L-fuconolactonase